MRTAHRIILMAAGAAALAACSTLPSVPAFGLRVKTDKPFAIIQSDKPEGWGILSHPWTAKMDDVVQVSYNLGGDALFAPARPEYREGAPAFSLDGGKTWEYGWTRMKELTPYQGRTSAYGIPLRGGGWVGFGGGWDDSHGGTVQDLLLTIDRVVDGEGQPRFSTRCRMPRPQGPNGFVWLSYRGVEMPDGTLLMPGHVRYSEAERRYCFLIGSTDGGRTWEYWSTAAEPDDAKWDDEGPSEPALTLLANGELLMIMRAGGSSGRGVHQTSSSMLEARSADGGKTWRHRRSSLPGVKPKLITMSNGVVVCAYGRPGNHLAFSVNNGATWGKTVTLSPGGTLTSGYCDVVEVSPGRLLAVYDNYDSPTSQFWLWEPRMVNSVYGVFIDVDYGG